MGIDLLPESIRNYYEVREWRHACAVLSTDFPEEWRELIAVLEGFRLNRSDVISAGGNKSSISGKLDSHFYRLGWVEKSFNTQILIDGVAHESPTHKVDCFKNRIAVEVEWNNKDPFYDRDLNNFRLLFDLRAIDVGVIITRSDELQTIFNALGKGSSYGNSTTHMSKLTPRILGGSGGGCPILVFGITEKLYIEA
ncbi:restriction endonuclease [Cohnella sp. CFH 77786]|uniref:BglII/BstYI family type II restriction endonuclease n=1 Tax=Cohnella sp. CFH 77786 TaxID=2662265 RepID=UPI001C60E083|nr:BglII/BstYI family type II restriction endonuclease [Cohnella sp. CFH 77786]MBW5448631.1 restriction endonuclease [Cohnella sp. CFH 77786]